MANKNYISSSDEEKSNKKPKTQPAKKKEKKTQSKLTQGLDLNNDDQDNFVTGEVNNNTKNKKKKTVEETYMKLSQIDHVLTRPDSYIGSTEPITQTCWIYDQSINRIVQKSISYVPGFYKIVDEILVNAADNKIRDPSMNTIKVEINKEEGFLSVYNNGKGIPVEIHKGEKIYVPEMIFGNLLTSSNYDDDEKKVVGGRNGLGAKLANIYSTEFKVETADKTNQKKYVQLFTDNMNKIHPPKITSNTKDEYTKITFKPDFKRFNMNNLDDDTVSLLTRRVYDLSGTVSNVKVYLNNQRIKINGFKQYMELYNLGKAEKPKTKDDENDSEPIKEEPKEIIYEKVNDRWELGFVLGEDLFQQISFVNSISTSKGGTHVNYIVDQITNTIIDNIKSKNKTVNIKPVQVKSHLCVFINCLIENPAFDSQTKENMTLKVSSFGSKCIVPQGFLKKIQNSGLGDRVMNWAMFKQSQELKKTDGKKSSRLSGIVKLEDANNAGTKKSKNCILILTEGDSAKVSAISGLSVVGRDNYGVFPLRGKLLNVREASHQHIMKNVEINYIKQILGLKHGKTYESVDDLRYGHIMIMTDQDHDGSHIKGLIINFLDRFYPSLLKVSGFLMQFITPIVKAKRNNEEISFFNIPEYEAWKERTENGKGWHIKYYKGLGTSTDLECKKYFSNLPKHAKSFKSIQDEERKLVDMAFSKNKVEERKEWLREFKPGTFMDNSVSEIQIGDFINNELILFSMADNVRSIPSVVDGLKPTQRKILYGCFKKNLNTEIKVVQLAGYISEQTAYHHGEQSLFQTIINMAQDFVGSNNVNYLEPAGQFGARDKGGKDASSPRYLHTRLMPITRLLFHKDDDVILNYLDDDNLSVEPEWYIPVLPTLLINGVEGIGTGWSTCIPNYNPEDIINNIKRLIKGEPLVPMQPWYRGFKGNIEQIEKDKYRVTGIIEKVDDTTVRITELPIKVWTEKYKNQLEIWLTDTDKEKARIYDYKAYHTTTDIDFLITMTTSQMQEAETKGLLERFQLISYINTSNMVCFSPEGRIKKYTSPEEILEEFYYVRMKYYQNRRQYMLDFLTGELSKYEDRARFILEIIQGTLVIQNKKRPDIIKELQQKGYRPFHNNSNSEDSSNSGGYDYLLSMPLWNLTYEKVQQMLKNKEEAQQKLDKFSSLTTVDLWMIDLDELSKQWDAIKDYKDDGYAPVKTEKKRNIRKTKGEKEINLKPKVPKVKKEPKDPQIKATLPKVKIEKQPHKPFVSKTSTNKIKKEKDLNATISNEVSSELESSTKDSKTRSNFSIKKYFKTTIVSDASEDEFAVPLNVRVNLSKTSQAPKPERIQEITSTSKTVEDRPVGRRNTTKKTVYKEISDNESEDMDNDSDAFKDDSFVPSE